MKKQFIAGAKCPECGLEDKIYVYHKDGDDFAQCNACGYISIRPRDNEPVSESDHPHAPEAELDRETVEAVVRFIP